MRLLLASSGIAALAAVLASSASAETVISTAITTPVATGTANDDIRITSTGSVKPTGGAAVTINSNDSVKNEGTIAIKGANGSTGILANTNLAGDITNTGTITLDEDYTPTDSDTDGDIDGPFAQGSNRFGIHVLGGGSYTGNIANSGTITIEGNQSAGIAIDSALTGSFTTTGKVSVLGNDSVGIRTGAVSGNVTIGTGSTTTVQGANAVGVLLGGDIGGALVINGSVSTTGYRSTTAPADASKLDSDDLLQGGSAVVVGGSVAGGILLDSASAVTSFGAAPALTIGSTTQDVAIGFISGTALGLNIKGAVKGVGVYQGVSATGLSIGGTGHATNVAGAALIYGSVTANAVGANATALHVGAGATVPALIVNGTISADGGGVSTSAAQAILIDAGANVSAVYNTGSIVATRSGTDGTAGAIIDRSGTLSLVQNSGQIGVTNAGDIGDKATAIDLSANTTGATVRQIAPESGSPAPRIVGSILFGTGNDLLDIQAGTVVGKVDFGGGTDVMNLGAGALYRGSLFNSAGLAVTLGAGATLDVQNLGTVNLASLNAGAGSALGVTIGDAGHTLYNVAGTASFGTGTKVLVTLDRVGTAAGTYTIIDAGTLVGAENLTSSVVTLPFLFTSALTSNATTGEVVLNLQLKGSGELGLNRSEAAILDAALDAADADKSIAAVFLNAGDSGTLKNTLQQLMPDHAGGAFEAATKGSRLASQILSDPQTLNGLWLQQVAWGSSKSIGDTSNYDVTGWGATAGYGVGLGPIGTVGITAGYLYGHDGRSANELLSNHYEGGVYWRGGVGRLRGWARATAGTVDFKSTRNFSASLTGGTVARTAEGKWNGRIYSASGGVSYEARMGRLSLRPNASIEYYKLTEKGYAESGGGGAFDLTVRKRSSDEAAANALVSVGYDFVQRDPDSGWLRLELEGGRREILSGSLGDTIASFGDGDPFTLTPEQRTSGWRGGLRVAAGGSGMSFVAEANAEEQQGKASLGGRVGFGLAF